MKKLIILIIVLACMGCSEICSDSVIGLDGTPGGCEQSESCGPFQEFDECTCQCEWSLF